MEKAVLAFLRLNILLSVELAPILEIINSAPQRSRESQRFQMRLEKYREEQQKYIHLKEELYPDYKAGLIDLREYETFRQKYEGKLQEIEHTIQNIQAHMEELSRGITPENRFIKEFCRFNTISALTREVVCALIENVYIYEDNRIEIDIKYRDEFETILEYLDGNRAIIAELDKLKKDAVRRAGIAVV